MGAPRLLSCSKPRPGDSAYGDRETRPRPFRIRGFVVRPSAPKGRHVPPLQLCHGCANLRRHRDALGEVKPWGEHLLPAREWRPSPSLLQSLLYTSPAQPHCCPGDTRQPLPQTQACGALPSLGTDSRIRPCEASGRQRVSFHQGRAERPSSIRNGGFEDQARSALPVTGYNSPSVLQKQAQSIFTTVLGKTS